VFAVLFDHTLFFFRNNSLINSIRASKLSAGSTVNQPPPTRFNQQRLPFFWNCSTFCYLWSHLVETICRHRQAKRATVEPKTYELCRCHVSQKWVILNESTINALRYLCVCRPFSSFRHRHARRATVEPKLNEPYRHIDAGAWILYRSSRQAPSFDVLNILFRFSVV